ncbi:unnamed protein product, partial [Tetraodon nigroviridis]
MGGQVSTADVHVVVVGGGFGGISAALQLQSRGLSFTLVDMRDSFHHNVAGLRASLLPGFANRTFIPYVNTFGDRFVQGRVEHIDPERRVVVLEGGREIQFTHLILSTGTDGAFPGRFVQAASHQSAVQAYQDFIGQVQAADSVLVIGGGSTGVEMAAEIRTEYPEKKVVLVHSKMQLADPGLLPIVRYQAKEVLLEKGVQVLLGHKVANLSELKLNVTTKNMQVLTDKGERINADLIICCTGLRVNSSAYQSSFSDHMTESGALKVNEHLQVEGSAHIFAIGDCNDVDEAKTAYNADRHASVAVGNIVNSVSGRRLAAYRTGNVTMLLAMGRDDGVGQVNGFQLPRCLVALFKSRDLLLWKSWKDMRQKQP